MEVPVINRIGDFEGGIASLQNPSVFSSRAFASSGIGRIYQAYSFWKWGTLFLAVLLAYFTTIITRVRVLLFRLHKSHPISSETLLVQEESDYDTDSEFSDDDESEDEDEDGEEDEEDEGDEDFSFGGASNFGLRLRRRSSSIGDFFSWPEFANGTSSVVKMWDNFGLGLDLNLDGGGDQNSRSIFGGGEILGAPAVIISAEANMAGNLLRVWDSRVGSRIPQMLAEWRPKLGKMVSVNAGLLEKISGGELTVADMRKVSCSSVVGSVTESETADTWWDADAVNGRDDEGESTECDSFMRRG